LINETEAVIAVFILQTLP